MGTDLLLALAFGAAVQDAAKIPFLYHRGTILFDASIRDREVLCLLDTGAEASAVDERLAEELALEADGTVTVIGTAGSQEVVTYTVPALTVGALRVEDLRATGLDLDHLFAPDGARVEAIVGFDFLGGFALEIDFDARVLVLERPAKPAGAAEQEPRGIPMRLDRGVPRVPALLDGGVPADFRIDTGASLFDSDEVYVNVTTEVWTDLRAADPDLRPHTHFTGSGIGGELRLPVARIASLELGGLLVRDPHVIVQPPRGYFATEGACGFFGNNLLEKHGRVRIDYPGRRLVLGSGPRRDPGGGDR